MNKLEEAFQWIGCPCTKVEDDKENALAVKRILEVLDGKSHVNIKAILWVTKQVYKEDLEFKASKADLTD